LLGTHEAHRYPQGMGTLRKTKIGLVYILSKRGTPKVKRDL